MNWLSLDAFLTRIRPYREALALALDMVAVALAWQATYLFRLGFERWFEARPGYDHWVMLGIVALYGVMRPRRITEEEILEMERGDAD